MYLSLSSGLLSKWVWLSVSDVVQDGQERNNQLRLQGHMQIQARIQDKILGTIHLIERASMWYHIKGLELRSTKAGKLYLKLYNISPGIGEMHERVDQIFKPYNGAWDSINNAQSTFMMNFMVSACSGNKFNSLGWIFLLLKWANGNELIDIIKSSSIDLTRIASRLYFHLRSIRGRVLIILTDTNISPDSDDTCVIDRKSMRMWHRGIRSIILKFWRKLPVRRNREIIRKPDYSKWSHLDVPRYHCSPLLR